jgi:hypothetical protein
VLADSLIVREEEQLILDNPSADRAAELVVLEWVLALCGIFEEIPRIELFVAKVFVQRAMEFVGAATRPP